MSENFDKEYNNTESEQTVEEQAASPADEVSGAQEPQPIADEFVLDEFEPQKINIPEIQPIKEKTPNKGLKVFCVILAADRKSVV